MIVKRMTARFGALDGKTLELEPGLNVITLPNEAGKSTWTAFFSAMLYGVDGARSTKTSLSPKQHYQPWDNGPMEGRMELEYHGRQVILERTGKSSGPMRSLRAWDAETGEKLPELTSDACGQNLTGVEQAVFERSALIGQGKLPLTTAPELERRLAALVTGEDETSYTQAKKQLTAWRSGHSTARKNGSLDQAVMQRERLRRELRQQSEDRAQAAGIQKELEDLQARARDCRNTLAVWEALDRARLLETCRQAEREAAQAAQTVQALEKDRLLSAKTLSELQQQAAELSALDPDRLEPCPKEPETPKAFLGCSPSQVQAKAREDYARCQTLARPTRRWPLFAALACLAGCLVLALTLFGAPKQWFWPLAAVGGLLLAAGVVLLIRGLLDLRRAKERQAELDRILDSYDANKPAELLTAAEEYLRDQEAYVQALTAYRTNQRAQADYWSRLDRLLQTVNGFAPAEDLEACREAIERALGQRRAYDLAVVRAQQAAQTWERLRPLMPEGSDETAPTPPALTQTQAQAELERIQTAMTDRQGKLAVLSARLPDEQALARQEAQERVLAGEIARLEREYRALGLALEALEAAEQELRARFAPALARQAGEILAQLTGGTYDSVQIDRSFGLEVRARGAVVSRGALWLSGGTADQLYLAVRLALCRLLLPPDTPIVLDDALVNFDDRRMALALTWLRKEAETRQIILFTCQGREERCLAALEQGESRPWSQRA